MVVVLTQKDFKDEEDELLDYECETCGYRVETGEGEDIETCEKCGSEDILKTTAHEGAECSFCHYAFDMWEDACRKEADKQVDELLICGDCHDKLPY